MKIEIIEVGKNLGYEDYHNDYYLEGKKIGSSSWDKKQNDGTGLHIGELTNVNKNFYSKSPEGIAHQMEKVLFNTL